MTDVVTTNPTHPIVARLSTCYTGVVHDVMRAIGLTDFTLPSEIRPLIPETGICGPLFTIEGAIDRSADAHESLLAWTGLLSKAKSGHIWVCQPHNHEVALMGELSAETLQGKGVLGCVIDGGIRDTHFLLKMGFQSWRRFHTPQDIVGCWLPTGFDVPISIGKVHIRPGDYMLGDRDGLLLVPHEKIIQVTEAAEIAMQTENKVRTAILGGTDPQEAYLQYGKF